MDFVFKLSRERGDTKVTLRGIVVVVVVVVVVIIER